MTILKVFRISPPMHQPCGAARPGFMGILVPEEDYFRRHGDSP
jgi:hypothetical protein